MRRGQTLEETCERVCVCVYLCVRCCWSLLGAWHYSFLCVGHMGRGRHSDTPERRPDRRSREDTLRQRMSRLVSMETQPQLRCGHPRSRGSTLVARVAVETWGADAASMDGVARSAIDTAAGLIAAVTVGTGRTDPAAGLSAPSSIADATVYNTGRQTASQPPLLLPEQVD